MQEAKAAVLVVEDEPLILMDISQELSRWGIDVFEARDAASALEILKQNPQIAIIFTDVDMPPGSDGLALGKYVKERWPPIQIIVTSGKRSLSARSLPFEGRFIPKPYDTSYVTAEIASLLQV